MATDELITHVGIRSPGGAMLRPGMSREEPARLRNQDIRLDYRNGVVAFIELPKHRGTLDGIELFEAAADEVVVEISRPYNLDPAV
jgi:hypothetical protein